MCLAQGPQRSDAGEPRTRDPLLLSQALYHWATALPCGTSTDPGFLHWELKSTKGVRIVNCYFFPYFLKILHENWFILSKRGFEITLWIRHWGMIWIHTVCCSDLLFPKYSFTNTIIVSNSLNPDQNRHSVGLIWVLTVWKVISR